MKIVSLIAALAGVAFASTVSPTGAPSFGEIESVEITEDEIVDVAEEIVDDFSTEVEGFDTIVLVESASEDVVIAEKFNEENEVIEVMVFELEFDPVNDDTPGAKGVELSDDDFAIVLTELCEFAAEGLDVPVEALLCEAEYDDDGEVYVASIFSSEPPPTASPTVPVTESPTEKPETESPTEKPETESPTEGETESPTEKPETESPTEKPETDSPTEGETESPTEKPETDSPTEGETESPTEDTETQSPTEEGQTQSPTEEGQTQSPTEEDDRDDDAAKASSSVWFKNIFADAGN